MILADTNIFGIGAKPLWNGGTQYFAFYGIPVESGNWFTTAEITEEEYENAKREYPERISATKAEMMAFADKYIQFHKIIMEATNHVP